MAKIKHKVEMTLPELMSGRGRMKLVIRLFIAILMVVLCISIKFKICR